MDLGSWCILRMASADTLRVFKALQGAGYDVWTPVEKRTKRMPRTRVPFDKEIALMPSYVFGSTAHLDEFQVMAMMPGKDTPRFSMFRYQGGIPLIGEAQLAALRAEEARCHSVFEKLRRRGIKGPTFSRGDAVRLTEGGFAGMSGVVEDTRGRFTLVSFAGYHAPIQIASLLLQPDVLAAETEIAAEAA